ncbi:MAG TPA: tyrosine-type recombinase/integrase [Candidatus Paceibacterota bacterium]|nr:tyrosine-type recombinase/integrase [Candidatus Paceibacterota bacterium]
MKKDVHHHEQTYKNWRERVLEEGVEGISKANSKLYLQFIFDMENGENVSAKNKKGKRGYGRLNVLRQKLKRVIEMLEDEKINDVTKTTSKKIHKVFNDISEGKIRRLDTGEPITYISDYVANFKAFWHWWMKINRKKGKTIEDITEDLSVAPPKVKFVYISKENVDKILPYFNEEQQVLVKFLFDSIIRFPTECLSLQVKDIYEKNGEVWVNIPDEVSKTYGRTFNLLYCGDALKEYIKKNNLKPEDRLFGVNYLRFTQKLKKVALQVLGDSISHPTAQGRFSELTGYDFRHSGAIHLRQLAQRTNISLDAIRQRGGWTDFVMLNYYTQFLGLTGEIRKEDLLISEDKTRLEKEIEKLKQQRKEDLKIMKKTVKGIIEGKISVSTLSN